MIGGRLAGNPGTEPELVLTFTGLPPHSSVSGTRHVRR